MAGLLFKVGLSVVALLAVLFQIYLKEAVWLGLGIGKTLQPLSDFPYTCRTITDSRMEACEDMWLSESTRQLFLACSDPIARSHWMPSVADFNITGRSQRDAMVVLDIDKPVESGFEMRVLKTPGYTGTAGDGLLDLAGFTGIESDEGFIELLVVNHRPSVDAETGEFLDNTSVGGNSTIELFETGPGARVLRHVRTYANTHIATPNRVTAAGDGSFFVANDHGPYKLGLKHHLSPIIGTGDVTYCDKDGCRPVAGGLKFPNGLVNGQDGLLYVPSSMLGTIAIYRIAPTDKLEKVDEVSVGYGIDNLSIDKNGDMYIAAFPVGVEIFKAYKDPYNARPPSVALRMRKREGGYVVEKIIEDAFGEALPVATTVIHDAKTGRLFFSSVISPFISVCEPKN
ncbi:hypothetical protein B0J13DRAFT_107461 [Dactylonectria estremocensis]|uniref:SMP-30/Gluconolactonase/LRE-like region domain-containing protein n=1 Tax=Dactylonectria estremocensis TaxID=1079267 RepID=A0A9P9IUT0_9HYPO|nr:hypothetical protein B0J13DRAFT_107461 [Dactylonectria estremocensis]